MEARHPGKMAAEVEQRLAGCAPEDRLRLVIKLRLPAGGQADRSAQARAAAMARIRQALAAATRGVDDALAACGGLRLSEPNALGTVVVEVAARDVATLAEASDVELVMEDASVFPVDGEP